jgi:hypothetical protein
MCGFLIFPLFFAKSPFEFGIVVYDFLEITLDFLPEKVLGAKFEKLHG